jgi:hypothetical protein
MKYYQQLTIFLFICIGIAQSAIASKDLKQYAYVNVWSSEWRVPDSTTSFNIVLIKLPSHGLNPYFGFSSGYRADVSVNGKQVFKGRHKQASFVSIKLTKDDSIVAIRFYKSITILGFQAILSNAPVSKGQIIGHQLEPEFSMLSWVCLAVLMLSSLARIYDSNLFFDMFNFTKPLTKESGADFLDLFTGRVPPIFLALIFIQAFGGFAALILSFPHSWLVLNRYVLIDNDLTEWLVVSGVSSLVIFGIYIWILVIAFLFGQKEKERFLSLNLEIKIFYVFSLVLAFVLLVNEMNHFVSQELFTSQILNVFMAFLALKGIFIIMAFSKLKPGATAVRISYICAAHLVPLFAIFQYLKAH